VRLITNFVVIPWDDTGACCRGMAKDKKVCYGQACPYLILLHNMVSTADGIGDVFRQSPMLNFVAKCKCYIFYRMTVLNAAAQDAADGTID